jgi:hypothetical protein
MTPDTNLGGGGTAPGKANGADHAGNEGRVLDEAKRSGSQMASEAASGVKEKATSFVEEKKSTLAAGLTSIADELRRSGEALRGTANDNQIVGFTASYEQTLADRVEGIGRYIDEKDIREMASDLEAYARRNPAMFIGGAFLLGFAASRFIKSGRATNQTSNGGGRRGGKRKGTQGSTVTA